MNRRPWLLPLVLIVIILVLVGVEIARLVFMPNQSLRCVASSRWCRWRLRPLFAPGDVHGGVRERTTICLTLANEKGSTRLVGI